MVSFRSVWTTATAILSVLGSTWAVPLADKLRLLSPSARDVLKRSIPAGPRFVVYNDQWANPFPSTSELRGFNVFALSFLLTSGAVDEAENWQRQTASQRDSYLQEYHSAGISLIVSAFGSTQKPTTSGVDAVKAANSIAQWVKDYGLDGVDIDYEDLTAFNGGGGTAESWLITLTRQLRDQLPQGQYILTHAPIAPWFSPNRWSGGGYLAIDESVGSLIDWYNIQFYNQGASEYTTCSGLLDESSATWPETSLFQIAANGISLDKLVIEKPASSSDTTNNGYMDPSTLASCVSQASSRGWNGGLGVWRYPDATSFITPARGNTWPVSGS